MAKKVNCQVIGGTPITHDDVDTVRDAARRMNAEGYQASVNGEPAGQDTRLQDFDYVSFAPAVKGGR